MGACCSSLADTAGPFEYDHCLQDREIRLLKFKPRLEGTNRHLMNFELNYVFLPSKVIDSHHPSVFHQTLAPYIALSYVCGPEHPKRTILVDRKPFHIRVNLERALAQLEKSEKKIDLVLPIWTDALCINQAEKENKEEEAQVLQMKDVYVNAVQTVVWLADSNRSTGKLMAGLDRIGKEAIVAGINNLEAKDFNQWPDFDTDGWKTKIKDRLVALMPETTYGFPLSALVELSYRPWFTRVWVQQEFALSSHCKFMCGEWTISEKNFIAGTFSPKLAIPNSSASATLGTRMKWQRNPQQTLKAQLCRAFVVAPSDGLDASEGRDRIYALCGITSGATKLNIYPHYEKREADGNYVKTDREIFTDVARALIQRGNLDILTLCRPAKLKDDRHATWPSWVPDWREAILPPWGGYIEDEIFYASRTKQKSDTTESTVIDSTDFGAAFPERDEMQTDVLTIKARLLGKVHEMGTAWNSGGKEPWDNSKVKIYLFEVMEFLKKSALFGTPAARGAALCKIAIGGTETNGLGLEATSKEARIGQGTDIKSQNLQIHECDHENHVHEPLS